MKRRDFIKTIAASTAGTLLPRCEPLEEILEQGNETQEQTNHLNSREILWNESPEKINFKSKKNKHLFYPENLPLHKGIVKGNTLDYYVKFNENCLYNQLDKESEGDWNKLLGMYLNDNTFEAIKNENNGAFVWKSEYEDYPINKSEKRVLRIGHYTHNEGHEETFDGKVIKDRWIQEIQPEKWYHLKLVDRDNQFYDYYFENNLAKTDPHKTSSPGRKLIKTIWFGGNSPAPNSNMEIEISKTKPKNYSK